MSKGLIEISLDAEILSRTPSEAIALILHLLERVSKLEAQNTIHVAQNASLEKRIIELATKLNWKSTNSNKPPSSDSPFANKPKPEGSRDKMKHHGKRMAAYDGYGR